MGKGDHSKTFLPIALYCWSTPSWLKVRGGGGGMIIVSAPVQIDNNWVFGFFRLGLNLGVRTWGLLGQGIGDLDLGLAIQAFTKHLPVSESQDEDFPLQSQGSQCPR